jgi:hypothetical protein
MGVARLWLVSSVVALLAACAPTDGGAIAPARPAVPGTEAGSGLADAMAATAVGPASVVTDAAAAPPPGSGGAAGATDARAAGPSVDAGEDDGGGGQGGSPAPAAIVFENLTPDESVPHALVVVDGKVTDAAATSITLNLGGHTTTWPIVGGHFRALTPLALGTNDLLFNAGGANVTLRLRHLPADNPRFIRFLYVVAADGDGSFEGPPGEPHDQASALARLRVSARLMQTFLAETMRSAGFGRMTFRLPVDSGGEPIIEVWKSRLTNAQARAMDGNALWNALYRELGELPDRDLSLDVAVMAMTHYVPASQTKQAHTALGGGRLGLFGSGTLFAHAATIDDVARAFSDARAVDPSRLPDDSAGRATMWANYATGIGAMEHELGHALSLPHPASHDGLMWRGFDHFNRTFMVVEPKSALSQGMAPVLAQDESGIDRSNAVRLRYHPWLALHGRATGAAVAPQIVVDGATLKIGSAAGIRHIQYLVGGEGVTHDEFLATPPAVASVPLGDLRARLGSATEVDVTTIDDAGNIASRDGVPLR